MANLSRLYPHGEQGKINGKEPGLATIGLIRLEKMTSCKIWLFSKYNGMIILDRDPGGEDGDETLDGVQLWKEHDILTFHGLRQGFCSPNYIFVLWDGFLNRL